MKVGYYPGCSLHATARELDESLRAVARHIGLELNELDDWSCCGATAAHSTNHTLAIGLAARNLWLASKQEHSQLMTPCAACFSRLATARYEMRKNAQLASKMESLLGPELSLDLPVLNMVDVLHTMIPAIKEMLMYPLTGMKVACYYGCLLVRPSEVTGCAEPDDPRAMQEVVEAVGATPVRWDMSVSCCGAGLSIPRTGSVLRLGREILDDARKAGACALIVACPMCQSNLDLRQGAMTRRGETVSAMPILFLSQLVGLALGLEDVELGLQRHFVDTFSVLRAVRMPKALPAAPAAPAGKPTAKSAAKSAAREEA